MQRIQWIILYLICSTYKDTQTRTANSWRGHMRGRTRRGRDVLWCSPWLLWLCCCALRDFPKSGSDNWALNPQHFFFSISPSLHFLSPSLPSSPIHAFFLPEDHVCLHIPLTCMQLGGGTLLGAWIRVQEQKVLDLSKCKEEKSGVPLSDKFTVRSMHLFDVELNSKILLYPFHFSVSGWFSVKPAFHEQCS